MPGGGIVSRQAESAPTKFAEPVNAKKFAAIVRAGEERGLGGTAAARSLGVKYNTWYGWEKALSRAESCCVS